MSTSREKILVQQIEEPFADAKYPGDNAIVPLYDNKPHCDECAELAEHFRAKHWKTVPIEVLIWERDGLPLFTGEAFRYYLPAFLRAALLHPRETDTMWENVFYSLTPPQRETGPEMARFLDRVGAFTPRQKKVLRDFVRMYLDIESPYKGDGRNRARKFWKADAE